MIRERWNDALALAGRNMKRAGYKLIAWGNALLLAAGRTRGLRW